MSSPRAPSSRPLREFLRRHLDRASGALEVVHPGGRARIHLQEGQVVGAVGVPGIWEGAGAGFAAMGDLGTDLGRAVAAGMDPVAAMELALRGIVRFLAGFGERPDVSVSFDDAATPPRGALPLPGDVPGVVKEVLREVRPATAVARQWEPYRHWVLRRRRDPPEGTSPEALRILRLAEQGACVGDAIDLFVAGRPHRGMRAWWALDWLLHVGVLEAEQPPEESSVDTSSVSPEIRGEVEQLLALSERLRTCSPLEALGLDPPEGAETVPLEEVREAFRQKAAPYHPDRLVDAPAPLREAAMEVFALLSAHREALEDPETARDEVRRARRGRSASPGDRPEVDLEKARVFYRRGLAHASARAWEAALEAFRKAAEHDPDDPAILGRVIFCEAILRRRPMEEAIVELHRVKPEVVRHRVELTYLEGWLLKLLGRQEEAIQCFRKVLELSPGHRDALREVRLYERRRARAAQRGRGLGALFSSGDSSSG